MGNIIEFKSLFTFLLQNNKFPKMKLFIIQQLAGQDIPDLSPREEEEICQESLRDQKPSQDQIQTFAVAN